jgi:hypothetical protein
MTRQSYQHYFRNKQAGGLTFDQELIYVHTLSRLRRQRKSRRRRLYLLLHHRLVPSPSAGLAGVRRSGEPNLYVEILVKVVFSSRLS